uniref:Cyclin N-terminal domain-containing protein n=1 Tax=Clastoptera arizonana TaxID=38151 RepID=A0A1B6CJZ0_9HEMI
MASRTRQPISQQLVDLENIPHASKATNQNLGKGSRIPKRAALGDITKNSLVNNKPKEPVKKTVSANLPVKPPQQKTKENVKDNQSLNAAKIKVLKSQAVIAKYANPFANPFTNLPPGPKPKPVVKKDVKKFSPVVIADNVKNIDKNDKGKIFLLSEYVNEIYKYLQYLELKFTIQPKYLIGQVITPSMRSVLVDWMADVQQQYHLLSETLHLSVAIVDLFLQKMRVIGKDKLQLVGVTAMFIACKYEETYSPDISDFVYITDSTYSKEQIISMERVIFQKLNFNLGRPSSVQFLRRYSKAGEVTPMHHTFAKYFIDLALLEYNLVHVRPSLIAAVASFISHSIYKCETGPCPEIWTDTLTFYSSYTFKDLQPYIPILAATILKAHKSKLKAIPKKFASSEAHKISIRAELLSDDLKKLAEGIQ